MEFETGQPDCWDDKVEDAEAEDDEAVVRNKNLLQSFL